MVKKLQEYVDDLNANIEKLDSRGPVSNYVLPDENLRGKYDQISTSIVNSFSMVETAISDRFEY